MSRYWTSTASLCAALLLIVTPVSSSAAQEDGRSFSLREALDNKLVEAAFCAIGASSGYAIIMAIKSRVGTALKLRLVSGTMLRSDNSGAQNMAVHRVEGEYDSDISQEIGKECAKHALEEEQRQDKGVSDHWLEVHSVELDPYQSQLYLLSAYCLDFEKDNPSSQDAFTVAETGNGEMTQLFRYLEQNPTTYDPVAVQLATWAVSGNVSASHIADKFPFSAQDRSDACRLLNEAGISPSGKALCFH
jgi:hypothetical protein